MNASMRSGTKEAPIHIDLISLNPPAGETWSLNLESEILTLSRPDDRVVLKLHRDEAARYLQFTYDVFRGRILNFLLIHGAKKYSFRCTHEQQSILLHWLPETASSYLTRQVRLACLGVALFGVLHLLIPQTFFWICGVCLLASGLAGLTFPKRAAFLINGVLMILAGLWDLSVGSLVDFRPWNVSPEDRVVPVIVGSLVLLWGIQQISMMGPNQLLRAVRAVRDERAAFFPEHSPAVRFVGFCNIAGSVVFGIYALALVLAISLHARTSAAGPALPEIDPVVRDLTIFGVFALLTNLSAIRFLAGRMPAYAEAKVSGQFLVSVSVLSLWGAISNVNLAEPASLLSGVVTANPLVFTRPHVWGSLILCVLGFNRWFNHAVDRELEEQRD